MTDQAPASGASLPRTTETTPLLSDGQRRSEDEQVQASPESTQHRDRDVVVGSWCSLIAATASVASFIAVVIMSSHEPQNYHLSWETSVALRPVAALSLVAVLSSVFNLVRLYRQNRPLHQAFNIVVDIIVGFYVTALCGSGISGFMSGGAYCSSYDRPPSDVEECERWRLAFEPVVWCFLVFGMLLGISHAILFLYRCVEAYRSRFGRGNQMAQWRIPTGQLTFEFTIKLLRQETGRGPDGSEGVHAASRTGDDS